MLVIINFFNLYKIIFKLISKIFFKKVEGFSLKLFTMIFFASFFISSHSTAQPEDSSDVSQLDDPFVGMSFEDIMNNPVFDNPELHQYLNATFNNPAFLFPSIEEESYGFLKPKPRVIPEFDSDNLAFYFLYDSNLMPEGQADIAIIDRVKRLSEAMRVIKAKVKLESTLTEELISEFITTVSPFLDSNKPLFTQDQTLDFDITSFELSLIMESLDEIFSVPLSLDFKRKLHDFKNNVLVYILLEEYTDGKLYYDLNAKEKLNVLTKIYQDGKTPNDEPLSQQGKQFLKIFKFFADIESIFFNFQIIDRRLEEKIIAPGVIRDNKLMAISLSPIDYYRYIGVYSKLEHVFGAGKSEIADFAVFSLKYFFNRSKFEWLLNSEKMSRRYPLQLIANLVELGVDLSYLSSLRPSGIRSNSHEFSIFQRNLNTLMSNVLFSKWTYNSQAYLFTLNFLSNSGLGIEELQAYFSNNFLYRLISHSLYNTYYETPHGITLQDFPEYFYNLVALDVRSSYLTYNRWDSITGSWSEVSEPIAHRGMAFATQKALSLVDQALKSSLHIYPLERMALFYWSIVNLNKFIQGRGVRIESSDNPDQVTFINHKQHINLLKSIAVSMETFLLNYEFSNAKQKYGKEVYADSLRKLLLAYEYLRINVLSDRLETEQTYKLQQILDSLDNELYQYYGSKTQSVRGQNVMQNYYAGRGVLLPYLIRESEGEVGLISPYLTGQNFPGGSIQNFLAFSTLLEVANKVVPPEVKLTTFNPLTTEPPNITIENYYSLLAQSLSDTTSLPKGSVEIRRSILKSQDTLTSSPDSQAIERSTGSSCSGPIAGEGSE